MTLRLYASKSRGNFTATRNTHATIRFHVPEIGLAQGRGSLALDSEWPSSGSSQEELWIQERLKV